MKSFKTILTAGAGVAALALSIAVPSLTPAPASAQVATPVPIHMRGERNSSRNLLNVRRRLERMIDELQRDAHDYGGNRVKAIADIQASRADIQAAIDYDATHGH